MKYKNLLALCILVILMFSLVSVAHSEPVTLRWAMISAAHNEPVIQYFAPLYEELTGIKVEAEVLEPGVLRDKMLIEALGGSDYYDIGYNSPGWFSLFYEYVVDLTPYIDKYNFDVSEYPDLVWDGMATSDLRPGEITGIPHAVMSGTLIYREDFFAHPDEQAAFLEEYGRELVPPETWQDLYEVAKFFTREAGETVAGEVLEMPLYGFSDSMRHPEGSARSFIQFIYTLGLRGFDEYFVPDIDHPILLEGTEFYLNLFRDTVPPAAEGWAYLEHLEYFSEGRLATAITWANLDIVENPERVTASKVGHRPLPRWEGNLRGLTTGSSFLGGGGLMIFDTPNSEEAFKFIQWLLEEHEEEWVRRTGQISRRNHFTDPVLLEENPYFKKYFPALELALENIFLRQQVPEYTSAMWNNVADYWTDVRSGDLTPEQAQERFVRNMRREFERAGYYDE